MNKQSEIMSRVEEHFQEVLPHFSSDQIVGIFLQGSQNYDLDIEGSDVDTKLVVLPSLEDIVFNRKAVSTTHIRKNDEHIDIKDIRFMMNQFRKQNINFLEILFTEYKMMNPLYKQQWNRLIDSREEIARYDMCRAIKAARGMAEQKFHALKHPYPSKIDVLKKYGYDPKQLHHIFRIAEFMRSFFIEGKSYEHSLIPRNKEYLKEVKQGKIPKQSVDKIATEVMESINLMEARFINEHEDVKLNYVNEILDDVLFNIMETYIKSTFNLYNWN